MAKKSEELKDTAKEVAKKVVRTAKKVEKAVKKAVEGEQFIDSKVPVGPLAEKWTNYKAHQKLVNPANKRRLDIIVVGTGLAGASAAASMAKWDSTC